MEIAVGLFYQMKYCMLEWAGATFVKLIEIQAWQELVFILSAISKIESREKASKLSFWWSDDCLWKLCFAVYVFWHVLSTFYASWSYQLLYWAFDYCLVCSVINAVKHQKVTNTLNNVTDSSMRHEMSVSYVRIYTQILTWIYIRQSTLWFRSLFTTLNVADSSQNKYQFLSSLDFGQFHKTMCLLLTQAYNIAFSYHLIEDTYSYPRVWKFPETMLKYLYMGELLKRV